MESSEDKHWASKYLLDPLTAPEPSEETGPGSSFRSTFAPASDTKSTPQLSDEKKRASASVHSYPSPPHSASPSQTKFPRAYAESVTDDGRSNRTSSEIPTSTMPSGPSSVAGGSSIAGGRPHLRRGSSLDARFPGDTSHRPLDMIKQEQKAANRAPHLRKAQHIGADSIDRLDNVTGAYHHENPYDATMLARNRSVKYAPVAALRTSNNETLRATPREKVMDSIQRHRPLDGVAMIPSGFPDANGRIVNYRESDLMIDEGGYKRWDGIEYLPGDLKGKGEPSYTIEKALKEHGPRHRRIVSEGGAIELQVRRRPTSNEPLRRRPVGATNVGAAPVEGAEGTIAGTGPQSYAEWESGLRRSNTTGASGSGRYGGIGGGLRKRIGSIRRKDVAATTKVT